MAAAVIVVDESIHGDVVTGKITCANPAVAINVSLGFIPSKVEINHVTDVSDYEWNKNMDDGTVNLRVTAGDKTLVSTGGITPYAGAAGYAPGFTIGTDATLNGAADEMYFTAYR